MGLHLWTWYRSAFHVCPDVHLADTFELIVKCAVSFFIFPQSFFFFNLLFYDLEQIFCASYFSFELCTFTFQKI